VLAERSVCLVDLSPALQKEDLEEWFAGHDLKPTKVFLDNEITNARALQPAARANVSWIVEFANSKINSDSVDYEKVERALLLDGVLLACTPLPTQTVRI
jgi:hypothetical protein